MTNPDGAPETDIATQLLVSSRSFARSAVRAYVGEDWDVFYLHMATAIEQLLKAVLARQNPLFIADGRGFDSLLHLGGLGDRAASPPSAVRTISVTEALERTKRLVDAYQEPSAEVRTMLETRNAIVHSGANAKGSADLAVGEACSYVNSLLAHAGTTSELYWADLAELVATHTSRRLDAIESSYERRLQAARERYAELETRLEDDLHTLRAAVEPQGPAADFSSFPAECPACGSLGSVFGNPSPNWEADWDVADGVAYAAGAYVDSITLSGASFDCRVCGLSLLGTMLDLAGIAKSYRHREAFDLEAASDHFTPDLSDGDY